MIRKNYLHSFFLVLSAIWFGWTLLVDIFVIPTIFQIVDEFFLAGDLGIAVFSKLNKLEVIVSTSLLALIFFQTLRQKKLSPLFVVTFLSWSIAIVYFSYLTPKLIELTGLWKQANFTGVLGIAGIQDVQQEHQFYHNLYIKSDVAKLILLSAMLFLGIWKKEYWG